VTHLSERGPNRPTRRTTPIVLLLCVISVFAGCGDSGAGEVDPAMDERAGRVVERDTILGGSQECLNREEGYSVSYPEGWRVNTGGVLGDCSVFDPEPVRIPRDSEIPTDLAIVIGFQPVPISTLAGDMRGRREISRETTTVDGRAAIRMDSESTGEGLHDAGLRSYEYFVDLGDSTMVAATHDSGPLPFARKRLILDAMMASFDFRQPG
jgi:hypothetical protein